MKRYAHYFLQFRPAASRGGHWETIEQARVYSVLKSGLAREIANDRDAEIRLVGAYQDDDSGEWLYTQLFYLDQSSVGLDLSPDQDGDDDEEPANDFRSQLRQQEERAEAETDDEPQPRRRAPYEAEAEAEAEESETSADTIGSWPRSRQGESDREAFEDLPPVFRSRRPIQKKRSAPKTIILLLLVLLVAGGVTAGVLLFLQHPSILNAADSLGLGHYARKFPHASTSHDGDSAMPAAHEPKVMPLTTGNVITYKGVAPLLVGRWSPDDCSQNYVEFSDHDYTVTREGHTSPEKAAISETMEDDFQYYLRRSPTLVEHLQKLGPNDIQMAGSTGTGGFMASGKTIQILIRCPGH